jgi:hypothetical protein
LHIQAGLPKVSRMVAKPYHDQERGDQERLAALGSTDQVTLQALTWSFYLLFIEFTNHVKNSILSATCA